MILCFKERVKTSQSNQFLSLLSFAPENNVEGTIPEEISNCKRLDTLRLQNNKLSGLIPHSFGTIVSMRELKLDTNPSLSGTIPDSLYDLQNLQLLDLYDCNFVGTLSRMIGKLGNELKTLRLSNNHFSGTIPSEFSMLSNLFVIR